MKTEHFNKLTPAEHERLSLLFGECGEVIQAISKIMRHGYESGWNGSNNRADLEKEISHVQNAIEMLINCGDVSKDIIDKEQKQKKTTIHQWLHHQM